MRAEYVLNTMGRCASSDSIRRKQTPFFQIPAGRLVTDVLKRVPSHRRSILWMYGPRVGVAFRASAGCQRASAGDFDAFNDSPALRLPDQSR